MCRRLCFGAVVIGVAGLLAMPTSASANLLFNPSFEIDDDDNGMPDGWGKWEPDYNNTGVPVHVDYKEEDSRARTGDDFMLTWQWTDDDEPGWDFGLFHQSGIPATAGVTYTSGIWIDNAWGDSGNTFGNAAFLKLEFFDSLGVKIDGMSADQDILPDGYHYYEIEMVAPAGTATVSAAYAGAGGYDWMRSMAFDDAVLLPEPTSLVLLALGGLALVRRRR